MVHVRRVAAAAASSLPHNKAAANNFKVIVASSLMFLPLTDSIPLTDSRPPTTPKQAYDTVIIDDQHNGRRHGRFVRTTTGTRTTVVGQMCDEPTSMVDALALS